MSGTDFIKQTATNTASYIGMTTSGMPASSQVNAITFWYVHASESAALSYADVLLVDPVTTSLTTTFADQDVISNSINQIGSTFVGKNLTVMWGA